METYERATRIAGRLASGELVARVPNRLWAGFGNGKPCGGSGRRDHDCDVEHKTRLANGLRVRFHAACSIVRQQMTETKQKHGQTLWRPSR